MSKVLETVEKKIDDVTSKVEKIDKALSKVDHSRGLLPATPIDHKEEGKYAQKSFGHFLAAVRDAERNPEIHKSLATTIDKGWQRTKSLGDLVTKSASGMNEAVDSDGGFLVPPTFSQNIFMRLYENDLLKRTDQYTVTSNNMTFPAIDETSRADGSRYGGVRAYWADEAGQGTASKPKFNHLVMKLRKLFALGYMTEELLSDSPMLADNYLTKMFAGEIEFKVGDALINGDGASMPLGILNSPAKITVAKDGGQKATSLSPFNIANMWNRMWAPSRKNAVWLINQDVEPALDLLVLPTGTSGVTTYMPTQGQSTEGYSTIKGRPVIVTEFNQTLGTEGDIILWDPTQYVTITKGAPDTAMSMHLRFDYQENAYRTTFRIDGNCWWKKALTPKNGSNTYSPIITLAARS